MNLQNLRFKCDKTSFRQEVLVARMGMDNSDVLIADYIVRLDWNRNYGAEQSKRNNDQQSAGNRAYKKRVAEPNFSMSPKQALFLQLPEHFRRYCAPCIRLRFYAQC